MEQIDYVAPSYLMLSWNGPRVARKFDKLCLQMFILTRSTKRDVTSTFGPSSLRHNEIHVLPKYRVDPSRSLKKFRGFASMVLPPRRSFSALQLDIRLFITAALDAPIRFDRSSIKTVFQPYVPCAPYLLWSMPTFLNPQSIVGWLLYGRKCEFW